MRAAAAVVQAFSVSGINTEPSSFSSPLLSLIHTLPSPTFLLYLPTSPFPILQPWNPWFDEFYEVQKRRATDFEAPKLGKGSSGFSPYE